MKIIHAANGNDIAQAKALFLEYAASLGFELCFQSFDEELSSLPGDYAPPSGVLLIAIGDAGEVDGEAARGARAEVAEEGRAAVGCAALRRLDAETCEIKRLYVRPSWRGKGVGRALAEEIVVEARRIGYKRMRLDAIRTMTAALSLYRSMGFKGIAPYRHNPIPGAVYLELSLE